MNRATIVTACVVVAGALAAPTAVAAGRPAARAAAASAVIRGAHFSPDTPGVDVYLTAYSGGRSTLWLSGVGYGDVSGYRRIKSGPYVVSMRAHGAAGTSPAALSWTLNAQPGAAYTVAAVGHNAKLHGIVLRDRLTPPRSGTGLVRVIQAASRVPHAKLVAGSQTVAADAAFASTTGYAAVPAGTWTVKATGLMSNSLSAQARIAISASGVYSVVVLDAKGSGIQVRVVRDAAGTAVSPSGSVGAGGGGTAGMGFGVPPNTDPLAWIVGAMLVALAGAALVAVRRRVA